MSASVSGGDNPVVLIKAVINDASSGFNGQSIFLRSDKSSNLFVAMRVQSDGGASNTPLSITGTVVDGTEIPTTPEKTGLDTIAFNYAFNGTSFDAVRNNTEETILANAARTATENSADFVNFNAKGLHAIINVTALSASPSIVATIQGKDPISGTYYDILEGLPITTTGINILKVYPGISAFVNQSASDILPRIYRVRMVHANGNSITYSVAGALII